MPRHSDGERLLRVDTCTLRAVHHHSFVSKRQRGVGLSLVKQAKRAVFLQPCPVTVHLLLPFLADFTESCREIAWLNDYFNYLPIAVNRQLQILGQSSVMKRKR